LPQRIHRLLTVVDLAVNDLKPERLVIGRDLAVDNLLRLGSHRKLVAAKNEIYLGIGLHDCDSRIARRTAGRKSKVRVTQ